MVERPRVRRSRRHDRPTPQGELLLIVVGMICWLAATFLAAAGDDAPLQLVDTGLTPATMFLLGAVALTAALVRRRIGKLETALSTARRGSDIELREQLDILVENSGNASHDGQEEAQQMRYALQRQDEKINNLTKAIKMYGKPLVDIAHHGTELSASLSQVRGAIETGNEAHREACARIEAEIHAIGGKGGSIEPLQKKLSKVEITVEAIAQRMEDSEVRKTLVRLEDTFQEMQEAIQLLLRGESIDSAANKLQSQLENATGRLHQGLDQLRDGDLGGLQNSVRDIQREVSTVATAVAHIQAAIKSGPGTPKAAAAPTSAPTPKRPAHNDSDDSKGYQTGSHKSGSKNVLGAIARLKQLKS